MLIILGNIIQVNKSCIRDVQNGCFVVTVQGQPEMIHSAIVGDDGNRPDNHKQRTDCHPPLFNTFSSPSWTQTNDPAVTNRTASNP